MLLKNKKIYFKIFFSLLILCLAIPAYAAYNTTVLSSGTLIYITDVAGKSGLNNGMYISVSATSNIVSMTVGGSTLSFSMEENSSVSLTSTDKKIFSNNKNQGTTCGESSSTFGYTAAATETLTITFSTDNNCATSGGGSSSGGGGGGGGSVTTTPVASTQSTGSGESTTVVGANESVNAGAVSSKGKNAIMGESSQVNFGLVGSGSGGAIGTHAIKVQNISIDQATLTISSEPIVFVLAIGKSKNVDMDGDQYRDVKVTLNRIVDGKADITIKELVIAQVASATPGSLVKIKGNTAVYYIGPDGVRYVFPNAQNYFTWYADFSQVKTISDDDMAKLPIGALVTYRPGTRMVKFLTNPDVYAVTRGGVLRKLKDEAMAEELYGKNWNKFIDDVNDAFYGSYLFGSALATSAEYNLETQKIYSPTIMEDKDI